MKTVQPYWVPQAEAREQTVALATGSRAPGNRRLAGFAAVALLAITALNLGATAYLAGAIAELRTAEERLANLSAFEKRIMERLEVVNNGVQSQFDNLLQVTDGRMAELRRDFEMGRGRSATEATDSIDDPAATIAEIESPPVVAAEAADTSLLQPDAAPRPQRRQAPPSPNPAYQRIEGPNGKVTYRKLQ